MSVHVIIKRKLKISKPEKLIPFLADLTNCAKEQPGYISTMTLQSIESPEDYLVISEWAEVEDWQRWFASKQRRDLQGKVDSLIGERTFYEVFKPV